MLKSLETAHMHNLVLSANIRYSMLLLYVPVYKCVTFKPKYIECLFPDTKNLIGLKAIHVVGASDAPGTQELKVDFHRGLHEDNVVLRHAKTKGDMETIRHMT
jgi:hypothetical protein